MTNNHVALRTMAPAVAEALPRFAPVEELAVVDHRLTRYAAKLGFEAVSIGAYEGTLSELKLGAFNAVHYPHTAGQARDFELGRMAAEQPGDGTLALELNTRQIEEMACRQKVMRSPQGWAAALDAGIKTGLMDNVQQKISAHFRCNPAANDFPLRTLLGIEMRLVPWLPLVTAQNGQ